MDLLILADEKGMNGNSLVINPQSLELIMRKAVH
jgi:hypothetical protein